MAKSHSDKENQPKEPSALKSRLTNLTKKVKDVERKYWNERRKNKRSRDGHN